MKFLPLLATLAATGLLIVAVAVSGPERPAAEYAAADRPRAGAAPMSQDLLDSLLAPIALYPDQLLAQVLMASTYPLEVVEAARFVKANPTPGCGAR